MKKRKTLSVIGCILIIVLALTACGSKKDSMENNTSDRMNVNYDTATEESASEPQAAMDLSDSDTSVTDAKADGGEAKYSLASNSTITAEDPVVKTQDKIIRRFFLDVETQEFDGLITKIDSEINRLSGYVENSKISGKRFYNNNEARYGSIIVRIPRDKVDEFVNVVNENANVVNKEESTENVTLQYTDMESRKKSLEIEQERLFALLEKTDTLENIVTLESRLSDIRYQLQNYETQLRTYDNLVEYSTVTLSIQEVERITPVIEKKQTVGQRISTGFSDTVYNISEGFKNFFVWFVVNLPYLIIWAGIFIIAFLITVKYLKKKNKKNILPPTNGSNPPSSGPNPPRMNA